jgi:hypothetical protein
MSNKWSRWIATNGRTKTQLSRKQGCDAFVFAAPREDFEVLSRDEMAALSGEEFEDYNEARLVWNANLPTVKTAQLTEAYGIINQVMASGRRDADRLRGSVVIDAEPGLGKTTIATRYARDFHRRVYRREGPTTPEGHQRLPVAFVPLSGGHHPQGPQSADPSVLRPSCGGSRLNLTAGCLGCRLRDELPDDFTDRN